MKPIHRRINSSNDRNARPDAVILASVNELGNKRTECEPSQFGSSREHIAAANAASKGPPTFLCGF